MKKRIAFILCLLAVLLLGGCSLTGQASIYDAEVQTIEAAAHFSLDLPADWQVYLDENTRFAAASEDGRLAILVLGEFGGFTFYNPSELGEKVREYAGLDNLSLISDSTAGDRHYTQVLGYTDAEGSSGILYCCINNPYTSVVFYTFIACSEPDYAYYENSFEEISKSFRLLLTQQEFYEMIEEGSDTEAESE